MDNDFDGHAVIDMRPVKTQEEYNLLQQLYIDSFPPEERRPWDKVVNPELEEDGRALAIHFKLGSEDFRLFGLITLWNFDDFVYIEHFAIYPECRNLGVGSLLIRALKESMKHPIVLEAELPGSNDMAERRIAFYERNGLVPLHHDYVQPPVTPGQPELPLLLLSSEPDIDVDYVEAVLRRCVYKVD